MIVLWLGTLSLSETCMDWALGNPIRWGLVKSINEENIELMEHIWYVVASEYIIHHVDSWLESSITLKM